MREFEARTEGFEKVGLSVGATKTYIVLYTYTH